MWCPAVVGFSVIMQTRLRAFQRPCGLLQRGYLLFRNKPLPTIPLLKPTVITRIVTRTASAQESERQEVKPYSEIPLKKGWPLLSTALEYGKPEFRYKRHKLMMRRVEELGRIFRERSTMTIPERVVVVDPAAVETVFRADGKLPRRLNIKVWEDAKRHEGVSFGLLLA